MNKFDLFLYVYFYQLEKDLNKNGSILREIKFQSEEANTDEELKIFFKKYIQQNNVISAEFGNKRLLIERGEDKNETAIVSLHDIFIKKVWLPHELTPEMKIEISKTKESVYTNPDLLLQLDNLGKSYFVSIELKSTKGDTIPGSSVQQVSPYEWVIFVKHNNSGVDVSCGFYINSITEKLPFPDRSPRPIIGHKTMKEWNNKHRIIDNDSIQYILDEKLDNKKKVILENWEYALCNEWLETIQQNKKQSEKWFNNTIRIFTLELIELIENNPTLLQEIKAKLKQNIK